VASAAPARRRTSVSAEVGRKERRRAATGLYLGDDASASLASRPCTSTRAPACASLEATSRPTPSVEPVTSAVFPLRFSNPTLRFPASSVRSDDARGGQGRD